MADRHRPITDKLVPVRPKQKKENVKADASRTASSRQTPVWLYVPNLIGYVRVVTGLGAFKYAFEPSTLPQFMALYVLSYALDACDGVAARRLGQTSRFGAVLDMVTDRICTAALLAALAHIYAATPYSLLFIALLMLDVGSHWVQMYSSLATGQTSHKSMADEHPLVRLYYNWVYLFTICLANEACLVMLFVAGQAKAGAAVPAPFNFVLPALGESIPSMPLHQALVYLTAPVCALKQLISLIQLRTAAGRIVAMDEAERAEKAKTGAGAASGSSATPGKGKATAEEEEAPAAPASAGRGRSASPARAAAATAGPTPRRRGSLAGRK